jgi:small subunit ribosomal protein S1
MVDQFLQDIYASRQSNKILTGELSAIEIIKKKKVTEDGEKIIEIPCGIVFYGDFKILIPSREMNIKREDQMEIYNIMKTMIGAPIDFIVVELDAERKIAVASRKKAMDLRSKLEFPKHAEGDKIPVRIVGIGRTTAYVEAYGVEVRIPKEEIDWGYISDLRNVIQIGDVKTAVIQEIDMEKGILKLSIKRATDDPYFENIKKVTKNSCYEAVVTGVESFGIFFELKHLKHVSALCPYPHWEGFNPEPGDTCVIKIKRIFQSEELKMRKIDANLVRLIRRAR